MWQWFKNLFDNFVALFRDFLSEALPIAKQIVIGQLKKYAIQTIELMASTDMTNESKREESFRKIKAYAVASKIEVADSLINLIIELAVQRLKN